MIRLYGLAVLTCAVLSPPALAHVTLSPTETHASERTVYTVRMPNERKVASTRLDLAIPGGVKVMSFRQVPGWALDVERGADGAIVGAHWTGTLMPEEYVEFAVMARNPDQPVELVWNARQSYADGTVVEWSGAPGSKTPAPRVSVTAAVSTDHSAHH